MNYKTIKQIEYIIKNIFKPNKNKQKQNKTKIKMKGKEKDMTMEYNVRKKEMQELTP